MEIVRWHAQSCTTKRHGNLADHQLAREPCCEAEVRRLLGRTNLEDLGAAVGTYSLVGWLAVLHGNRLDILHLFLLFTFDTIALHDCLLYGE